MSKSIDLITQHKNLAELRTWQSGVLQSRLIRSTRRLSDAYLKRYDLTTMHWFIIGTILDAGDKGIRTTELAEQLGTTMGYLTTAINTLVLRKMVVRNGVQADGRTKLLTIASDFKATCSEIEEGLREIFRQEIYQKISREELTAYITVLQKLSTL